MYYDRSGQHETGPTDEVICLWRFTMPPEANYGRFLLTVKGKTVEIRHTRHEDGGIGVAVWGQRPPPIFLDDILTDSATEEP